MQLTSRAQMLAEFDAIDAIARRLAAIATRRDAERKQDLIVARRELAAHVVTVMTIGEHYPPIRRDEALYAELRQRLNQLRAAIADHQARWSAVTIDSDDAAYVASSDAVQAAGRDFMQWIRRAVESARE